MAGGSSGMWQELTIGGGQHFVESSCHHSLLLLMAVTFGPASGWFIISLLNRTWDSIHCATGADDTLSSDRLVTNLTASKAASEYAFYMP